MRKIAQQKALTDTTVIKYENECMSYSTRRYWIPNVAVSKSTTNTI